MIVQNHYIFGKKQGNALSDSLLAGWQFNGNYNDIKGSLDMDVTVVPPTFTTGINGQCVDFVNDNSDTRLFIPDSDLFTFYNGKSYTLSMWVNFNSFSTDGGFIMSRRTSVQAEWILAYSVSSATFTFRKYSNGSSTNFQRVDSNTFTPTLNTWYHLCITDAGTGDVNDVKFYVNGVDVSVRSTTGTYVDMVNTGLVTQVGGTPYFSPNSNYKFKGKLDGVYLFDGVKSSTEVTQLASGSSNSFYPFN